ncbi:hypothetical protein CcaCcLH18_04427 [Colletotrichum camelliae]|nr:hypothetical protein CcaCcLH18_04427 [Colletotrichum camelliae]
MSLSLHPRAFASKPQFLARILAELSTESSDISIRPILEKMAKELLQVLEVDPVAFVERHSFWLDADATLICDSGKPGCPIEESWDIHVGKKEIREFFLRHSEVINGQREIIQLDFTLVVADRGRITSLYERHRKEKDDGSGNPKVDLILVIMDLNASNDIERLHYRYLENSDHAVKKDKWKRVIRIDEEAWEHGLIIPKRAE